MTDEAPDPLGRGELQRRAIRGALWTGIHTLVSLPVAFLVNILIARVLDVEGYGRLTYLTTLIGIASVIAGLGVTTALIQFGSKAHAAGRPDEVRRLLSGSQGFRLLVSGPLVALVVVGLVRVDWWLLAIALVFGVGAPAALGGVREVLTIENRTDRSAQITMVGNIAIQAAVVAAVLLYGTADAVWSARIFASGLTLVLPLVIISKQYRSAVLRPSAPWSLPRKFWAFAIPTGVAGVIGALVSNRTEVVVLDWFSDEYAMGLFGLAFGLAGHVYAPAQAFIGPLVPAISGLSEVDRSSVRSAFLRTTRTGCAVGGALVVSALPALAVLLPLIYGSRFAPASDMLLAMGVASAITLVGSPHGAFLMARLGGRRILWVNIVSLVVNLTLAFALIPVFGAWGAVVACAGAMIVRAAQVSIGEVRAWEIPGRDVLRSLGPMLAAIPIAVLIWMIARAVSGPPVLIATVAALAGLIAFVCAVRWTRVGLTPADAAAIAGALPRSLRPAARLVLGFLQGATL